MFNRLSTVAPIRGRTAASTRTPRRRAAVAAGLASVALAGWPACASADDITIQFTTTNGLSGALGLDTSGFFQGSVFTDPMGNTQAMYMANSSSINFFTLAGSVEANKNSWFWTDPMGGGNLSLQASGVSGGSMSYSLTMTGGVLFSYNPYNADVVTTYLSFNLGGTNLFSGDVSNLSISNLANLTNASVGGSGSVRFVQDPYNTTISSYSFQIASVTINNSSSATPAQNPIAVYEAGGDVGHPDVLSSQGAIGSVAGSIGAAGSEAFYEFSWPGSDLFFANAAVPDADADSSFAFDIYTLSGTLINSVSLDASDGFTGALRESLAAGEYKIGLVSNAASDPDYTITFNSPVSGVSDAAAPEPSTWAMLLAGFAGLGFAGYRQGRAGAAAA